MGLLLAGFSETGLHQAKLLNPPAKSSSLWSFKKLWNLRANPWDCYWWNLASPATTKSSFQIHQQRLVLVVLQKTVEFKGESAGLFLAEFSEPGLHQAKLLNLPAKSSSLWSFKKLWNLRTNPWDCYWRNLARPASTKPSFQIHQQRARPCCPSKNCGI